VEEWQTEEREFVPPPEEDEKIAPLPVPVDDFNEFDYDDYLNSDEPMKLLARITSPYQRERTLTRMDEHAKALGYKRVRKDWAAYTGEQKAMRHSDENTVGDLPAKYGLELDCGAWISDRNGVRFWQGETEVVVCPHPIFPVERFEDIETGEQKLKIAFRNGERWKTCIVAKSVLFSGENVKALSSLGAAVTQQSSKLLGKYLAEVEAQNHDRIPEHLTTRHMGWFEGYGFVPYIENLQFDGDPMYGPLYDSIAQKGDPRAWLNHVVTVWNYSVEARIAIAASFASVLLHHLHVQPFFVHLNSGQSGTGKTVVLMVAASVWGNPANGRYIQTFNGTKASMEYTAGFLNNLPLILDELQLAKDPSGKLRFSVYDLTEGIGRGRAQKTGGIRRTERWENVFITSGESSLVTAADGAGAFNRVVNVEFLNPIVEDGARTADIVRKHYGWAGQLFIQRLEDESDGLLDELTKEYEGMVQLLTWPGLGKKISGKQANAASVLLNAAYYVQRYVFEGYRAAALDVPDILPFLHDEREISVGKRAYDFVLDWIGTNVNSFVDEHRCGQNGEFFVRRLEDVKGKLYGKIRADDVTLVIKSVFEAALMENGYSPEPVYKWLRANGKLKAKDAVSAVYSIGGTKVRCVGILTGSQVSQG